MNTKGNIQGLTASIAGHVSMLNSKQGNSYIIAGDVNFTTAEPVHDGNIYRNITNTGNGSITTGQTFTIDRLYFSFENTWVELIPQNGWSWRNAITGLQTIVVNGALINPQVSNSTITTNYGTVITQAGSVLGIVNGASNTLYGTVTLTADATITPTMTVGQKAVIEIADLAGFTLSLPAGTILLKGDGFEEGYVHHLELECVNTDVYTAKIHIKQAVPTVVSLPAEVLLFRHDMTGLNFFTLGELASVNTAAPNPALAAKYSILDTMDTYLRAGGIRRFRIFYPLENKERVWEQTSNPLTDALDVVAGYNPISTNIVGTTFGGLCRSNQGTSYIKGRPNSTFFWYGIGTHSGFNGGTDQEIPAYEVFTTLVELYAVNN